MPEEEKTFWVRVRVSAWAATRDLLFERKDRIIIAVLLLFIYLAIVWGAEGKGAATTEIILRFAASAAPILLLPVIFIWQIVRVPQAIYEELCDEIENLRCELEGRQGVEFTLMQIKDETLFKVQNLGPQISINVDIDLTQAKLGQSFHVNVEPKWLDGYAGGYRVLTEGSHNVCLIRKIEPLDTQFVETFYGALGIQSTQWRGQPWDDTKQPIVRRIAILINGSPRFPGGPKRIVFDVLGNHVSLVSGDVTLINYQ